MCCVDRLNPSHVFDAPGKPSPRQALPTFNDVALDDSTSLLWDATEVFECHQRVTTETIEVIDLSLPPQHIKHYRRQQPIRQLDERT